MGLVREREGEEEKNHCQVWRNNDWAAWRSLLLRLRKHSSGRLYGKVWNLAQLSQHRELFKGYHWQIIFLFHICPWATLKTDISLPLWGWLVPLAADLLGWKLLPIVNRPESTKSRPKSLKSRRDIRIIFYTLPLLCLKWFKVHYVSSGILEPQSYVVSIIAA